MVQEFSQEVSEFQESSQLDVAPVLETILKNTDGTPESIRTYFASLSFDEYTTFLNELNYYFRGSLEHVGMDGSGKTMDGYMPPDAEDRRPLMEEAYGKAMNEDSLAKCAVVLGMSVLVIHPYLDGNGRTSRTVFALLTNGYSGSDEDKKLFSTIGAVDEDEDGYHKSGGHIINLDPSGWFLRDDASEQYKHFENSVYKDMMSAAVENRLGADAEEYPIIVGVGGWKEFDPESELSQEQQKELEKMLRSRHLAYVACLNAFSDELYVASLKRVRDVDNRDREYNILSYDKVRRAMSPGDFLKLEEEFRQVRIDYVQRIMKITDDDDFADIYQERLDNLEEWKRNGGVL